MSHPENDRPRETLLQRKVKKIAVAWFIIHLIGFIGEIISKTKSHGFSESSQYWFQSNSFIYMAIETSFGLIISVCLFVGATKRIKYLLIPYFIFGVVTLLFFFGILVMFIIAMSNGSQVAFVAMIVVLVLIFIHTWMLSTTQKYYKELSRKHSRDVDENVPGATNCHLQANAPSPDDILGHATMNQTSGQDFLRVPSAINVDGRPSNQPVRPELPPAYSDTVIVSRDSTSKGDLPPSYDDAMAMKDKDKTGELV